VAPWSVCEDLLLATSDNDAKRTRFIASGERIRK